MQLLEAAKLLDIDLVDHIIIGGYQFLSLKERLRCGWRSTTVIFLKAAAEIRVSKRNPNSICSLFSLKQKY